jgi:hypothetical protein
VSSARAYALRALTAASPSVARRLWQLREVDGVPWSQISEGLDIDEPRLAKIRRVAVELGLAIKQPNGRVRWTEPGNT